MKKIILFFSALAMVLNLNAQGFEGRIVFSLDYPKLPNPELASMLPKESVTYFKNGKTRMEMNMAAGMKNATLVDGKTGETVVLMEMMGQKFALTGAGEDAESKKAAEDTQVKITNETKKIAGYTCTKAVLEMTMGDKGTSTMEAWFTKDLKLGQSFGNSPLKKIEGAILQYSIQQNGMLMNLVAKEIVKEKVADNLFDVPADFTKMTQEEFMKAMGQGGK